MGSDVEREGPTHHSGVRKGEEMGPGNPGRSASPAHPDKHTPGRTARDATSINPKKREPIDPSMPDMPPA
jgi:hypothetical protein